MQIIGLNNKINQLNTIKKVTDESTTNLSSQNTSNYTKPDLKHLQANFLSFKGTENPAKLDTSDISQILSVLDIDGSNLWDAAVRKARDTGCAEVNSLHFIAVAAEGALNSFTNREPQNTAILKIAQSLNSTVLSNEKR